MSRATTASTTSKSVERTQQLAEHLSRDRAYAAKAALYACMRPPVYSTHIYTRSRRSQPYMNMNAACTL
jgi:hypothetical protein